MTVETGSGVGASAGQVYRQVVPMNQHLELAERVRLLEVLVSQPPEAPKLPWYKRLFGGAK